MKAEPAGRPGVQVQCTNCGARGPIRYTEKESVDAWNRGIGGDMGRTMKFTSLQLSIN